MRTRRARQLFLAFVLLCIPGSLHAQSAGSFSGKVLLDNKSPLAGARVLYNKILKMQRSPSGGLLPEEAIVSGSVLSLPDGSFQIGNLPPGTYATCAAGVRPNQLRSCDWGQGSSAVQVTAGSSTPPITLNVRTGALLTIQVEDPSGLIRTLDPAGTVSRQTNVALGVFSELGYYAAKQTATAGIRHTHTVAVPLGHPIRLVVQTPLNVFDDSGHPVTKGQPGLPFQATAPSAELHLAVRP